MRGTLKRPSSASGAEARTASRGRLGRTTSGWVTLSSGTAWVVGGIHGPKRPNMFEESIRVPLLVRWPGVVKPGSTVDHVVSNVDTFASILGMLKVPAPADAKQHGLDFSPLLRGEQPFAAALARHRAARAPLPAAQVAELRTPCPAAEGREADMAVARRLLSNPTAYSAALLPVSVQVGLQDLGSR